MTGAATATELKPTEAYIVTSLSGYRERDGRRLNPKSSQWIRGGGGH